VDGTTHPGPVNIVDEAVSAVVVELVVAATNNKPKPETATLASKKELQARPRYSPVHNESLRCLYL